MIAMRNVRIALSSRKINTNADVSINKCQILQVISVK
jgi:hypothetical protein